MVCAKTVLPREMIGRMESSYSYREIDETHSDGILLRVLRLIILNVRHMVLLVSMFWERFWAAQSDAGEQEVRVIRRFRGSQMQN